MTSCPTPSDPADDRATQREAETAYYRAMLHELAELGMDLARAVARQAAPQPTQEQPAPEAQPTQPAADPTVAFERVARTIRRTIALARTLDQPVRPAQPRTETAAVASEHRVATRQRVLREVEDVIQRRAEGAEADCLRDELYERLADPGFEHDLAAGQPVAEVIQLLLRDLGLAASFPGTRAWARRTPQAVRDLRARAAQLAARAAAGPDEGDRTPPTAPEPRPETGHSPAVPWERLAWTGRHSAEPPARAATGPP